MSPTRAQLLQRVVVRMLHDPTFASRIYDDPARVLQGSGLRPADWEHILRIDPRAWTTDPERPSRVFEAIRREYPAACASAELASGGRRGMLRFFASVEFHSCVMDRGLLAGAFGDWLRAEGEQGRLGAKPTASLARLERACVDVRRVTRRPVLARPQDGLPERLAAHPERRLVELPEGTLGLYQELLARLAAGTRLSRPRLRSRECEWIVVEPGAEPGSLRASLLPEGLARLMAEAERGVRCTRLRETALTIGAEQAEVDEILEGMLADGLLCPA